MARPSQDDLTNRLRALHDSGALSDATQARAGQILARLEQPVRITLAGLPNAGKSALFNFLAGSAVLPEDVKLPTLQLLYGESAQTDITLKDGTIRTLDHARPEDIASFDPIFVEMHLPLAALKKISLLEVVMDDDIQGQRRALGWAAKRSDIVLWCSQNFDASEHALWSGMPRGLKDHAILAMTKADLAGDPAVAARAAAAIQARVADEFSTVLPIASLDANDSRRPDGNVDMAMMMASGGRAMVGAVRRMLDMGLRSVLDAAEILLLTHDDEQSRQEASAPAPVAIPEPVSAAPAPMAEAPASDPIEDSEPTLEVELVAEPETVPDASPVADLSEPEPVAENVIVLLPETRAALEHAVSSLTREGEELLSCLPDLGEGMMPHVIARSVERTETLVSYLSDIDSAKDPHLRKICDTMLDASELLQLMQMEHQDSTAIEAVSLMIQLKREMQEKLAA